MKIFCVFLFFITSFSNSQNLTVDKIEFLGTKRMNTSFLKKMILTKSGAVLDSTKLGNDIQLLNRLNGVSKAEFKVVRLENNLVKVDYTITENFSLIPNASAWTTDEIGAYRIGLYDYNFLGKNNTIGGFYQYNGFHSFGINFASPQFFSPKFGIGTNIQKLTTKEPLYFSNSRANYTYTIASLELVGNYQINTKNEVKLGFTFFNEKYDYLDGAIAADVPQILDLNKQLIKMQYSFDNVNYDYYLVNGFKSNFFLQYVFTTTNLQEKFAIGWNDFLFYKRIGNKGNWASRLRLGLATNNNSPFAPFSVDNNLNVRGVGNVIDRGTAAIVFNTEFRKTLFEKKWFVLQGNAFVDSGTWRNPGGGFNDFTNSTNLKIYPGLGLRFIHKTIFNAILRIDYGYGITKNATSGLVFGIGQYF